MFSVTYEAPEMEVPAICTFRTVATPQTIDQEERKGIAENGNVMLCSMEALRNGVLIRGNPKGKTD